MNQAHKDPAQRPSSNSDSLFGMALAQAFTAMVLGPAADLIWEAGEIASIVHEDRSDKRTNGRVYEMGVKRSLSDDFARPVQGLVGTRDADDAAAQHRRPRFFILENQK